MKKISIIFVIIIAILGMFCYIYSQKKISQNEMVANNKEYTSLLETEIAGTDLATLINKTINKNESNEVQKENGTYIENDTNSIIIEIKFIDSENTIRMESIYKNEVSKFIELYGSSKFKCTKVELHEKTNYVKYLYFEEINN